ncbi:MAG: hypothetical protein ACK41E_02940 [Deinococcales bacterium]
MKRFLLVFVGGIALAQAGFIAQPYGNQTVGSDGTVTLPEGGIIKDNKRGFSIDAKFVEYKDGAYLKARNAKLKNNTGQSLSSPSIYYTLSNDRMDIAGSLNYSDENVSGATAAKAVAYPDGKRVVAWNISATTPVVRANVAVFDDNRNEVFLMGNIYYKSKDGKTTKQAAGENGMLLVNFSNREKPTFAANELIPAISVNAYKAIIAKK